MIITPVKQELLLAREVLSLYRHFKKYDTMSDLELTNFLLPSLKLRQFAKHYHDGRLIGFTNWALLSDQAHDDCMRNGIINPLDWNSGTNIWHMETLATGHLADIMSWTKQNLARQFGIGVKIYWLRNDSDLNIRRRCSITTKEHWL